MDSVFMIDYEKPCLNGAKQKSIVLSGNKALDFITKIRKKNYRILSIQHF